MPGLVHMPTKAILAVAALLAVCAPAAAQDYPTRVVRIIIPLGPGGGGDVFTRALASELQAAWGQPVVVENRPGGSLLIGTRACAEAVPDGHTICVLSSEPIVYSPFLHKKLPYDPDKDFEPIANLFFNTLALVASSSLGVKTMPELIALAKARPGTLNYATFSFPLVHFMEKLKRESGADFVRVPFRSGNEVVTAVLSGSTPVALLALSNMIPHLQSGRIVGLAVNSSTRSPLFPDMPTFVEAYGRVYAQTWFGLFAPAGTPAPILARIARDVSRIVEEPGFRRRMFFDRGVEPAPERLADFARFIGEDRKVAARIVAESGFQPE
jgi:tripartite-type tricarboxylate transporter receptor subunit TctC